MTIGGILLQGLRRRFHKAATAALTMQSSRRLISVIMAYRAQADRQIIVSQKMI